MEILNLFRVNRGNCIFPVATHIEAGIRWLSRAQDATPDGGVSIRYSLIRGWESSYPETTGYIIPTFLRYSDSTGDITIRDRAIRMAEWLLITQQVDGSFIGGPLHNDVGKLVFDTGQIIFGLVNAYELTGENKFLSAAKRAGDWLISVQDDDGAWRNYSFHSIPHTYHSRVAWPMAELSRVSDDQKYSEGARRHLDWVLTNQAPNGWFDNAGFTEENNRAPYTHTIAYTVRGLLETGLLMNEQKYIRAALKTMEELLTKMDPSGYFHGTYDKNWTGNRNYSCLTGNAQLSIICSKLYMISGENRYAESAGLANDYLKTKQNVTTKHENIRGAIAGSSPAWGTYERFSCPNWATKFFIDALWTQAESLNISGEDTDLRKLLSFKYAG